MTHGRSNQSTRVGPSAMSRRGSFVVALNEVCSPSPTIEGLAARVVAVGPVRLEVSGAAWFHLSAGRTAYAGRSRSPWAPAGCDLAEGNWPAASRCRQHRSRRGLPARRLLPGAPIDRRSHAGSASDWRLQCSGCSPPVRRGPSHRRLRRQERACALAVPVVHSWHTESRRLRASARKWSACFIATMTRGRCSSVPGGSWRVQAIQRGQRHPACRYGLCARPSVSAGVRSRGSHPAIGQSTCSSEPTERLLPQGDARAGEDDDDVEPCVKRQRQSRQTSRRSSQTAPIP